MALKESTASTAVSSSVRTSLLSGDAIGKAFRRLRWWTTSGVAVDCSAEQRRSSGRSAFLELADDALSYIAHRVDRTNHLLLADHDLVEQAFKLCRYARVDQRRIGVFENPEQRQARLGGDSTNTTSCRVAGRDPRQVAEAVGPSSHLTPRRSKADSNCRSLSRLNLSFRGNASSMGAS